MGFTSTRLGLLRVLLNDTPTKKKKKKDSVRLECRTESNNLQRCHAGLLTNGEKNALFITTFPDMPILGFFSSAENKGIMSKIWTSEDTITCLSRKQCGKRRNCSLRAISSFSTMFSTDVCC